MRSVLVALSAALALAHGVPGALAGSGACSSGIIVVANDEWTLSNTGLDAPSDSAQFARNVAGLFSGGGAGSFLVYSNNFGLTGTALRDTMLAAGHAWTVSTATPFTLSNLLNYDGVWVCGLIGSTVPSNQVLIDYVAAGGNVYVAGGTSNIDASTWNTFLNAHGLSFGPAVNGITGQIPISGSHPLLQGVDTLYQASGSSITDTQPANTANTIIATHSGGQGLYAVYQTPPRCSGDINGDGFRNTSDLTAFLGQFGSPSPNPAADLNCDGAVNTLDLTRFLGSFGIACP